ncbi:titin isoform X3 [Orussus abietinus]|uniref:titin isoform X3 n=1 Tax=Orussus abietinus TaxID=222816 RepID=UPI000625E3D0|nr:titin isoform X3 [Orussus abietinus]
MAIEIKFTKFDNTPWGFRLAGGSDFPQPLTVIRVSEGSLAECMGLKVGDVVVRLNDQSVCGLTHGQAHEALILAGNNFVLGVHRAGETNGLNGISEDNIVPYTIPLEELQPIFPEEILKPKTPEPPEEEKEEAKEAPEEQEQRQEEAEKSNGPPGDPSQDLTDEQIAQLILEEEELLSDKGLLGVNFKKLRPRAPLLKESKVFQELQKIAVAEPPRVQELKRTTTFLQKPQRPVPGPKKKESEPESTESYKVVIRKQQKKSVTERLLEKGLLGPRDLSKSPESEARSEKVTPAPTPEPSKPDSDLESKVEEVVEITEEQQEEEEDTMGKKTVVFEEYVEEKYCEKRESPQVDKEKIRELVSTEISLEKQLENVQNQLMALKQLPSEIENHLRIVSEQLYKIMELSGVQNGSRIDAGRSDQWQTVTEETKTETRRQEEVREAETLVEEDVEEAIEETRTWSRIGSSEERLLENEIPEIVEPEQDRLSEPQELEIQVKGSDEEGSRVKKFIVSYESQVIGSRTASPAISDRSFEPDPNLAPRDQVIQELKHKKKGRKPSQELWPQARQLELTQGRRWRCPNDFFNDEMIAEVLSSQAEVIRGRTLGVNFKKFEKTHLPNYDHLMNSSVYKMIHKMEKEPSKGIPARPPKVNAAEDILERVKSPALSVTDDASNRSVSH